jgi:hypothetical protein
MEGADKHTMTKHRLGERRVHPVSRLYAESVSEFLRHRHTVVQYGGTHSLNLTPFAKQGG